MTTDLVLSTVQARVPDGWRVEGYPSGLVLLCSIGGVTIDLKRRTFALGVNTRARDGATKYTGRGWRDRIVDAAVQALLACRRPA